jgi:hypothetical protein
VKLKGFILYLGDTGLLNLIRILIDGLVQIQVISDTNYQSELQRLAGIAPLVSTDKRVQKLHIASPDANISRKSMKCSGIVLKRYVKCRATMGWDKYCTLMAQYDIQMSFLLLQTK